MVIRYAYRADEARAIKAEYEAQGMEATISLITHRGNHGRAGYHSVRGTLVAQPSYQITAYAIDGSDGMSRCAGCGRHAPTDMMSHDSNGSWCMRCGG